MSETRLKIAVFIDFDNIEIGVKTTLGGHFDVGAVLEAIKERGEVVTKVAYGDWTRAGDYSRSLTQHAIHMVQRNLTPGGDKNGADINLALDALEMAFTHSHINAFVIVGGDSDFMALVEKLKQYDRKVFVVGGRAFTSVILQKNCTEFIAYENLVSAAPRKVGGRSSGRSGETPAVQAVPLIRRALKVLTDREVSPQLGVLKSTLLQLDSTFSEREYGASTFRDFVQRLARAGYLTLKGTERNIYVELREGVDGGSPGAAGSAGAAGGTGLAAGATGAIGAGSGAGGAGTGASGASAGFGSGSGTGSGDRMHDGGAEAEAGAGDAGHIDGAGADGPTPDGSSEGADLADVNGTRVAARPLRRVTDDGERGDRQIDADSVGGAAGGAAGTTGGGAGTGAEPDAYAASDASSSLLPSAQSGGQGGGRRQGSGGQGGRGGYGRGGDLRGDGRHREARGGGLRDEEARGNVVRGIEDRDDDNRGNVVPRSGDGGRDDSRGNVARGGDGGRGFDGGRESGREGGRGGEGGRGPSQGGGARRDLPAPGVPGTPGAAEISGPAGAPPAALRFISDVFQRPNIVARWPLYLRQVKQILKSVDETFDERRYGFTGIVEALRYCQREGLFRLDRDRQGVLRVYPGPALQRATAQSGTPTSGDGDGESGDRRSGDDGIDRRSDREETSDASVPETLDLFPMSDSASGGGTTRAHAGGGSGSASGESASGAGLDDGASVGDTSSDAQASSAEGASTDARGGARTKRARAPRRAKPVATKKTAAKKPAADKAAPERAAPERAATAKPAPAKSRTAAKSTKARKSARSG